ncbi:CRISPR-associated helicase Cas3, subtype CYANO [Seinonella peptonophila]|uniref:CRISPR-associated helicase Cas3, subtype CYANO n=1 Tax=Seinonella peptonophila TaxID=112248 RepID=A0A1M5B4Y9_9BACL|nr:type I-D CRISPR-associated helicase Cas3' [Seinonella peptonophila]SHF37563.1 CRISPR-associated helicase Cas3, subtype CYANO [Seinonella peptonophila]
MIQLLPERAMTYDVPFIEDIKPYAHQVVQLKLIEEVLTQGRQAVIWNQALTGAGKTLANYSYLTKQSNAYALGVYPVNELIKDQYHSLQQGLPLGTFDSIALWTSEVLRHDRLPKESIIDQMNRLSGRYTRSILINPDYLMLISQLRLGAGYALIGQRSSPFYRLGEYNLQIFDEFHLYNVSQVNLLVQWMGLMLAAFPNKAHAFVLASATPRPEIIQLLKRLDIEILFVQEEMKRWIGQEQPPECQERLYLEPLNLHLRTSQLHIWETAERIVEDWGEVETYLQQYPTAKGLIILDSIHEAQKLAYELRLKGFDVGEVHGLSDRDKSREELAKPITVATATVEVGVDFQQDIHKDFLLFESRNAGSFMQRIGRIARGSREKPEIPIKVWSYVHQYVAKQMKAQLGNEATRTELQQVVQSAYRKFQEFTPYYETVGGMNLIHNYYQLKSHHLEKEQSRVAHELRSVTEKLYQLGFKEQQKQYHEWRKQKILEPVISFRGQNAMESHLWTRESSELTSEESETFYPDLWFWDETNPGDPLKRYHYQFVLSRRVISFISKDEMSQRIQRYYSEPQREQKLAELKKESVLGYALVTGWREKRASLYWRLPQRAIRMTDQLIRLKKLRLESENELLNEQLHGLFQTLTQKTWIVYITKQSPNELVDTWSLPPFFRLHSARTARGAEWSIAFNNEAFQLWSILKQPKSEVF